MGLRRRAREEALQLLYQMDVAPGPQDLEEVLDAHWESKGDELPEEGRRFAEEIVRGVVAATDRVDELIRDHAHNWRLERIAAVDRSVLRMAVWEMLARSDPSPAVVINEAIEIARRYSTDESGPFINGVLDGVRRSLEESPSSPDTAPLPEPEAS